MDKQSGKMSGGENQSPYFVAILASYLHAYNRHEKRWKEPSLALVPIDEAFSKLSGERIQDCLKAMAELEKTKAAVSGRPAAEAPEVTGT